MEATDKEEIKYLSDKLKNKCIKLLLALEDYINYEETIELLHTYGMRDLTYHLIDAQ